MSQAIRLVTADELQRMGSDARYELVKGQLVAMSPIGYSHGATVARLIAMLGRYVNDHRLGEVVTEVGFVLRSNPDTIRAPDIAFVRNDRVAALEGPRFPRGAPDLAIEVLSPEDRPAEVGEKVDEYLHAGVSVILVFDPRKRSVAIHRASEAGVVLSGDNAILEFGDLLPGFSCTLGEIFK